MAAAAARGHELSHGPNFAIIVQMRLLNDWFMSIFVGILDPGKLMAWAWTTAMVL
jgi:hypothetical protein